MRRLRRASRRMAEPQATPRPAPEGESLWRAAPGWRISVVAATLLTIASAGVFWLNAGAGVRQSHSGPAPAAVPSHAAPVAVALASSPARHAGPAQEMAPPPPAPPVQARQVSQSPEALPAKPIPHATPKEQVLADAVPAEAGKATALQPQPAPTSGSCAITLPFQPRHYGSGVIVSFIPSAQTLSAFARDEAVAHGRVDPAYLDLLQVRVVMGDGHHNAMLVPKGMKVKVGDRVGMQDGRRSSSVPCGWIPNMIVDDYGPAPATPNPATPADTSGQ
jgi:hypothetical protein